MPEKGASDTGPILHLSEIHLANCLTCLDTIYISSLIKAELQQHRVYDSIIGCLTDHIQIERVSLAEIETIRVQLNGFRLHMADLSLVVLADRLKPDVVLTDDLQLRRALETQGYTVVGSIGVLFRAYTNGIIMKEQLYLAVDQLFDGSSLYTSRAFRNHVKMILDSIK